MVAKPDFTQGTKGFEGLIKRTLSPDTINSHPEHQAHLGPVRGRTDAQGWNNIEIFTFLRKQFTFFLAGRVYKWSGLRRPPMLKVTEVMPQE